MFLHCITNLSPKIANYRFYVTQTAKITIIKTVKF